MMTDSMNCEACGLLILLENLVLHPFDVELLCEINKVQERLKIIFFFLLWHPKHDEKYLFLYYKHHKKPPS